MKKVFKFGCLGLIGLVVLGVIIGALGGGEDTATEPEAVEEVTEPEVAEEPVEEVTEEPAEEPVEEEPAEEPAAEVAGIGDTINVGDVMFTVNGVETAQNVGGEFGTNAQAQYRIVNVTIQNEKNEAITVDSSFFKLLSGDRTYEADGTAAIYANEDAEFFLTSVNPGVSLTGNVVFDVPADLENPQLQVQTGFFGTETGVINLQ